MGREKLQLISGEALQAFSLWKQGWGQDGEWDTEHRRAGWGVSFIHPGDLMTLAAAVEPKDDCSDAPSKSVPRADALLPFLCYWICGHL